MAVIKPKRGEIWWVSLDPASGSETKKRRPSVIVSNDISNKHLDRFQVVPLTSNTTRVYASECLVQVKGQVGKAMADQIRTVSKSRLKGKIAKLSNEELASLEAVMKLQLDL